MPSHPRFNMTLAFTHSGIRVSEKSAKYSDFGEAAGDKRVPFPLSNVRHVARHVEALDQDFHGRGALA